MGLPATSESCRVRDRLERLPIRIRRIAGGFRIGCGADVTVSLYIYAQSRRTNPTGLDEADAKRFAQEVARF
jgi:hypothetical protein